MSYDFNEREDYPSQAENDASAALAMGLAFLVGAALAVLTCWLLGWI